jgi:hypothetical protein
MPWSLRRPKMENDNSYPRLRALLQKQIAASDLRSSRDLVQSRPLQGFDESVEIHPILANAFPPYIFLARPTRRPASFFEYKRRSDLFSHELV